MMFYILNEWKDGDDSSAVAPIPIRSQPSHGFSLILNAMAFHPP